MTESPHPIGTIPKSRKRKDSLFKVLCLFAVFLGALFLVLVLWSGMRDGLARVNPSFLTSPPSELFPSKSGIKIAMLGSLWVVVLTLILSVPCGVAAAIYLQEIAKPSRLRDVIQSNIANLAGVPSIVFGILGLAVFVRGMNFGSSILAASLTMSLLVLPTIVLVTQEALKMVPQALREGSLALGATPWQTLFRQTLPSAVPTILTGVIFAAARAIGETAPLIVVGAVAFIRSAPEGINDRFTVMPITIYRWASDPKPEFHVNASAAIVVLLALLMMLNLTAIVLREKFKKT